jgi:hypothetical protein
VRLALDVVEPLEERGAIRGRVALHVALELEERAVDAVEAPPALAVVSPFEEQRSMS